MRRRELFTRVGAGGCAALGTGAAALLARADDATAFETASDAPILTAILELEQLAAFVARRVLESDELSDSASQVVRQVLAHERAHVATLGRELKALAGQRPEAPADDAAADGLLAAHRVNGRVSSLLSERSALELLREAEQLVIGAYFDGISKLSSPVLVQRSVQIMASEAQHAAVLAALLTPGDFAKTLPVPFVQGKR